MNKDEKLAYVVRYGFDYEHDNILGVFSNYYYAGKAKKEFERKESYDYVKIECYLMDEVISNEDR